MSFQQGLSGLNAAAKNLDVIGNNVANSGTVGYKASQAQFADVYAASLSGAGSSQTGLGTKVTMIVQEFTQGNVSSTNNPLDVAITGKGFFRLSNSGEITYSRNGQFQLDKSGYIVSSAGLRLTGYQVDVATKTISGALGDMQLNTADISPNMTTTAAPVLNLDSGATAIPALPAWPAALTAVVPATVPPTYVQPSSSMYNSSTSTSVYDSQGNSHVMSLFFSKDAVAVNTWNVHAVIDGGSNNAGAILNFGQLVFNSSGQLASPIGPPVGLGAAVPVGWNAALGVAVQSLTLNFNGTTQFGSPFGVNALTQDGYSSGRLAGFNIGIDGMVLGRYTNGKTNTMGQVALANFANPQGLQALGDNKWAESPTSGQALVGVPGTSSLGTLQSGAVEDSNVDLTAELVNMITAQRVYQANAQTIKTQDAVMQTLVNLR